MLKPRESIRGMSPYHSPIVSREGLCLDLNENMAGCSPRVLARLRAMSAEEVARYPLREDGERLVARFLGIAPEQVLLTNGMDDGLALLFSAYLSSGDSGDGDELLFADPTFVMYPMLGEACGAKVVRVRSGEDLALPVEALLGKISSRTRVIAVVNPNNPTGLVTSRSDLLRIVEAAPEAAVLVDEAYFEFCGETLIGELSRYPNLFVGRTFSKAYGLAGMRLGVLAGTAEQIGYLRRFCPPFNVNSASMACLEVALADQVFVRESVTMAQTACRQIETLCGELGLRYWRSSANFVLVQIAKGSANAASDFSRAMRERGVVVRDASFNPGCEGCVRITVGTADQMKRLLPAMRESLAVVAR